MNKDAEAIKTIMAWLMQEPNLVPSGKDITNDRFDPCDPLSDPGLDSGLSLAANAGFRQSNDQSNDSFNDPSNQFAVTDLQAPYVDPLDSEDVGALFESIDGLPYASLREEYSFFHIGEKLAVQDRFFALLKRRLQAEIERKPPLFPWETDGYEYEAEPSSSMASELGLWVPQLSQFQLPVPMPDAVLTQLFERCQSLVRSSLREGTMLVQAVEDLFPGQSPLLNELAGRVLMTSYRGAATQIRQSPNFPKHYDVATPAQQMLLSLLAARDLLHAMTLQVLPSQPRVEQQWETAIGVVTVTAQYFADLRQLRIQAQLPAAGRLQVQGETTQAAASCAAAATLSVELFKAELEQRYSLDIVLDGAAAPLMLAVSLEHDA